MTNTNDIEEHMMVDCRSAEMQMEGMRGSAQTCATGSHCCNTTSKMKRHGYDDAYKPIDATCAYYITGMRRITCLQWEV